MPLVQCRLAIAGSFSAIALFQFSATPSPSLQTAALGARRNVATLAGQLLFLLSASRVVDVQLISFCLFSDGDPILAELFVKYQSQLSTLHVNPNDLYNALLADAENTPPNWNIQGRQADAWKKFGGLFPSVGRE